MDFKLTLQNEHSKELSQKIADYIGNDLKKYRELWSLVKSGEKPISQRAAWALDHCKLSYSPAVIPFLPEMIAEMQKPVHVAVKRNVMKIIAASDGIPEELSATLFDLCMDWIVNKHTAIAVKVYAMEIAGTIAMPYPELRDEVALVIKEQMKHGSAGIRSRGHRILKRFEVPG